MIRNGFYIIKDSFFSDMSDPYLKGNKNKIDHTTIVLKMAIIMEYIG